MEDLDLYKSFPDKPIIHALIDAAISLVPLLTAARSGIDSYLRRSSKERFKQLLYELACGDLVLTEELISSDDFLYAFNIVANATVRTRRLEKIKMFAKLLSSSSQEMNTGSMDDFEFYFNILDELSYKEIVALVLFERYVNMLPAEKGETGFQKNERGVKLFIEKASQVLNVPDQEIHAIMVRLPKSGCFRINQGGFGGVTDYQLTYLYRRLKQLAKIDSFVE